MLLLDKIVSTFSDLIIALPAKDKANRTEIREVLLGVQTQMERSIELTIVYINASKQIPSSQQLSVHLKQAPSALIGSYNEHEVCTKLYGLADRFKSVFSSIKGSIAMGQINAVEKLICELASGESIVIEGLRNTTEQMYLYGEELSYLTDVEFEQKKTEIFCWQDQECKELRVQLNSFRASVKDVLDRM
ncbi:hypothetical protein DBZ36_12055 [Alginatibacterium sediminis]|uniref:Uncharacterized protein n=1 Tax=Alginatibacterium sediminis TaxID=2164068 RepID=A0A420EBE2_9ALTE|nr:hypothetical protein [Alginatibacterium sediminis]RKF17974.1 hypothetical protein DBZ36_12055 [Alginatibacterium sediminis]